MASKGNKSLTKGIPTIKDAFVVIVKTEWNKHIVDELEAGALRILNDAGVRAKTFTVPGAVEISFAIKTVAANSNKPVDAFIALGVVIRGDTPHFEYVCQSVTDGIASLNLMLDAPVVFGVLTVNNEQQALERIGGLHGHKGEEAAITAIKMIALNRKLRK